MFAGCPACPNSGRRTAGNEKRGKTNVELLYEHTFSGGGIDSIDLCEVGSGFVGVLGKIG